MKKYSWTLGLLGLLTLGFVLTWKKFFGDWTPVTWSIGGVGVAEAGTVDDYDWGDRCDTTTGRIAVPDFFRSECFAPFTGDNGGATAPGVTADEITIVFCGSKKSLASGAPIAAAILNPSSIEGNSLLTLIDWL